MLETFGAKLGRVSRDMLMGKKQRDAIPRASWDVIASKIRNLRGIIEDTDYRISEAGTKGELVIGKRFRDLLNNKDFQIEGAGDRGNSMVTGLLGNLEKMKKSKTFFLSTNSTPENQQRLGEVKNRIQQLRDKQRK